MHKVGDSLYGGGVVGRQITGGVDLSTVSGSQTGFYNLANGYASPTGSVQPSLCSMTGTLVAHFAYSGLVRLQVYHLVANLPGSEDYFRLLRHFQIVL